MRMEGGMGVAAMGTRLVRSGFSVEQAKAVAIELGVELEGIPFDIEEFRKGMEIELEHGLRDPQTNVTGDDPILTGKIALAHLRELPDYYTRLAAMESEAES